MTALDRLDAIRERRARIINRRESAVRLVIVSVDIVNRDIPALECALRKVLELHAMAPHGDALVCVECLDGLAEEDWVYFPCPTVRAIEEALG